MSQYKITANLTNGSAVVTVPGVDVTAFVHAGYIFIVDGSYVPYHVASEPTYSSGTGNTTITLSANYAGATASSVGASVVVDYTSPDLIPTIFAGDVGTAAIFTEAMYRIQALLAGVNPRELTTVNATGSVSLDVSTVSNFLINLQGTTFVTLINAPSGRLVKVTLYVKQDSSGGHNISFMNTPTWDNNTPPSGQTSTANRMDVWEFFTLNGGTSWYGSKLHTNM